MATGDRVADPYANYMFKVEIDGITRAAFSDASGFDTTIEVVEYREGGDQVARQLPGAVKFGHITLKWGLSDPEMYEWFRLGVAGPVARKTGSIVVLDRGGQEQVRWNFTQAWPTKWHGPDFSAKGTDVAIETVELAHEGIVRA